jgi:4-carboxymuconolactone decarboxylase
MTHIPSDPITLGVVDDATSRLVRVAAAVAASDEPAVRDLLRASIPVVPPRWIEEVILQTHLFAGFPRALNAMREWRRLAPVEPSPPEAPPAARPTPDARAAGEATCHAVYGAMYERLRENIRALHPSLDEWMIVDGYGNVLSRPGLDLPRRELCIVAACAACGQQRQLQSHLHGALNVGVAPDAVRGALDALDGVVDADRLRDARLLFDRLTGGARVH